MWLSGKRALRCGEAVAPVEATPSALAASGRANDDEGPVKQSLGDFPNRASSLEARRPLFRCIDWMFLHQLDLTTALRPSLLPEETLLFVQDAVGLYEGYVIVRVPAACTTPLTVGIANSRSHSTRMVRPT